MAGPEELRRKRELTLNEQFNGILDRAFRAPKLDPKEVLMYERLVLVGKTEAETNRGWRAFVKATLEVPMRKPEEQTIESLVMAVMSSGVPVKKTADVHEVRRLMEERVKDLVHEMPGLKGSSVIAAVYLAALLQKGADQGWQKLNFRRWAEEKEVTA